MKKLLIKYMPNTLVRYIKILHQCVQKIKLRFFGLNPTLTHIYYTFFSAEFRGEHYAVYKGKEAYINGVNDNVQGLVLLRRNIHRVEKGLIMRPRRALFGIDYIPETIKAFKVCVERDIGEKNEIKWGYDVLSEYFNVVDLSQNDKISSAYELFKSTCKLHSQKLEMSEVESFIPYTYAEIPKSTTDYSELGRLFLRRRSVRWFKQDNVPLELLEKVTEHASLAPSACNRQPFKFYAVLNQERATELADIAMGTRGFSSNIPAILAVVGDLSSYPFERDRHVIYIDGALASMQLMLSLDTVGLSSCPINWPDIPSKEKKITEHLKLKPFEKVIMLIAIGYADEKGKIPFSQKKSKDSLLQIVG